MSRVLLVNPWVEDFSAFDLWLRPLGLLQVGALLLQAGCRVELLDLLAREEAGGLERPSGTGKFASVRIPRPPALAWADRRYRRYGMAEETLRRRLRALEPPDWVFLTCVMTYWYPGVVRAARLLREYFPAARMVLGGVYAALCPEHARATGAFDAVVTDKHPPDVAARLSSLLGCTVPPDAGLAPAYALYGRPLRHAAVITGWGCPYGCSYCATPKMYGSLRRKAVPAVLDELEAVLRTTGAPDVAFYDDSLLLDRDRHFKPILQGIVDRRLTARYHLPNAVHPACLDGETARLMKVAGFKTVWLGFEGSDPAMAERSTAKVDAGELRRGVACLREAGFSGRELGAYLMFGLPGQDLAALERDMQFVHGLGVKVSLSSFSPIPGTPDGDRAAEDWPELRRDPLLQNKTLTLLGQAAAYAPLRTLALRLNRSL